MSLYPSLEDMKVDQMAQAQATAAHVQAQQAAITHPGHGGPPAYGAAPAAAPAYGAASQQQAVATLYPSLNDYMGMAITPEMLEQATAIAVAHQPSPQDKQVAVRQSERQIAPISGQNMAGIQRAEIKEGVRQVVLCKDGDGKIGLRVRSVNKGIFVAFVHKNSPASLGGLRFGDQILQINGETLAGYDTDKCMKVLKKAPAQRITMAIRDRPFERTLTLQKDSTGHVGFVFKDNKITAIVKDSSAARNGVLIDHHLVEVDGQNVVGLKEKEIKQIFDASPRTVTITIIPTFIYDHIVKSMGSSLFKSMDHSVPDM